MAAPRRHGPCVLLLGFGGEKICGGFQAPSDIAIHESVHHADHPGTDLLIVVVAGSEVTLDGGGEDVHEEDDARDEEQSRRTEMESLVEFVEGRIPIENPDEGQDVEGEGDDEADGGRAVERVVVLVEIEVGRAGGQDDGDQSKYQGPDSQISKLSA